MAVPDTGASPCTFRRVSNRCQAVRVTGELFIPLYTRQQTEA